MSNKSFITFEQTAVPTDNVEDGDLWLNPTTGAISRYSSGAWVEYTFYPPPAGNRGVDASQNLEYITINTPSNATVFGDWYLGGSASHAACSNAGTGRGLFGMGYGTGTGTTTVSYISIPTLGNAQLYGNLIVSRYFGAATSNGINNRGLFAGGCTSAYNGSFRPDTNAIDYVTISTIGNASTFGQMEAARNMFPSTSNGTLDRGIFVGGNSTASFTSQVSYITISTTGNAINYGSISPTGSGIFATSNSSNGRAIVAGGGNFNNSPATTSQIWYITIANNGNTTTFGNLSPERKHGAATSNGTNNRAVFIGGTNEAGTQLSMIDYVEITTLGNSIDFGNMVAAMQNFGATSNA